LAATSLWLRQPNDSFGVLGLALNACDERSNGHREGTEQIRQGLLATRVGWGLADSGDEQLQRRATRGAFRLLHLANILAVTNA
jgi:hypothetical protein